jgi:hypothetical protein
LEEAGGGLSGKVRYGFEVWDGGRRFEEVINR